MPNKKNKAKKAAGTDKPKRTRPDLIGNQFAAGNINKRIWTTPLELWNDFKAYAEIKQKYRINAMSKAGEPITVDRPLPIQIEGFCAYYEISRKTFYSVAEYKDYNEKYPVMVNINGIDKEIHISYSDTIARINEYIEQYTNENAAIGNFEGRWFDLYAKNKFGYTDKQETTTDHNITVNFNIPRPQDIVPEAENTIKIEGQQFEIIDEIKE